MNDEQKRIEEMAKDLEEAKYYAMTTVGSLNNGFGGWYGAYMYNKGYRKQSDTAREILDEATDEIKALEAENEELKAENAELKKRLENAVELPCIEPMTTWDWDATTGLGKTNFGKYWKVLYRDEDGEFIAYMGATKEEATAMLAELKGEKNE